MTIHVVRAGESVDSIAAEYGVPPHRLAVGQTLVVRFPKEVYAIEAGDTLFSIAARYGTTVRQLWRNNWELGGQDRLTAGGTLVISYFEERIGSGVFNGYAYPYINDDLLAAEPAGCCRWMTKKYWKQRKSGGQNL